MCLYFLHLAVLKSNLLSEFWIFSGIRPISDLSGYRTQVVAFIEENTERRNACFISTAESMRRNRKEIDTVLLNSLGTLKLSMHVHLDML